MSTDMLPSGRGRRMEARRLARERRRKRLLVGGGALGVLALVVGLVVVLGGGGGGGGGDDRTPARTQRTMLLQVKGDGGLTTMNALLADDSATGEGAVVLVPPQVLAVPPGSQSVPFGQVLRSTTPAITRDALADLMGITVDVSWIMDASALVKLVNQVGGVTVDVDVRVVRGRQVLLSEGTQRLSGSQALAFATYLADGEQEPSRLARLQGVLDGLLERLPGDEPALRGRLQALGFNSLVTGTDMRGLAQLLLALKRSDADDALRYDTLPVVTVETGAATPSQRIDDTGVRELVDRLLAASVPPGVRSGNNRVKVFNGVGTPMLGNVVRAKLVKAGLVFVGSANASRFGVEKTEIQIGEPTPQAIALGERVAKALGVPRSAVRQSDPTTVADVVVVVGADFQAG